MASSPLFSRFCDLVKEIGRIKPKKIKEARRSIEPEQAVKKVLYFWISKLRSEYDDGRSSREVSNHLFRFLYPEEGTRRRYYIQEPTLAPELIKIFKKIKNFPTNFAEAWKESNLDLTVSASIGSLGKALELELKSVTQPSRKTFKEIDRLLDKLAARSEYSSASLQQNKHRDNLLEILEDIYRDLSGYEAGIMTQIILRDLSPFLRPIPSQNRYEALTEYNTTAYYTLTFKEALNIYDGRLAEMYNFTRDLDYILEQADSGCYASQVKLGIPVAVAESFRAEPLNKIVEKFSGIVHCDVKYDGNRAQIHYDSTKPNNQKKKTKAENRQVSIFSKSCRDSTEIRFNVIEIFLEAIKGMGIKNGIFEAEIIAYDLDEKENGTFDQLTGILSQKIIQKVGRKAEESYDTGDSISSVKESPNRLRLKLVFFDILFLNDQFLGDKPFSERRALLVKSIQPQIIYAVLARQIILDFANPQIALPRLRQFLATVITNRDEGLMLRSATASHLEGVMEIKKAFIRGCGDTLDFIVPGGSWTKERGRELGAAPGTLTTFFVGVLKPSSSKVPHYRLQFTIAYGLDRKQLLNLNDHVIDTAVPLKFVSKDRRYQLPGFKYTFEIASNLNSKAGAPTHMFERPFVVELTGSGFQRDLYPIRSYSLRWPRITKLKQHLDSIPLTLEELNQTAEAAMLRIQDPFDCFTFTDQTTPILSKEEMISKEEKRWIRKLEMSDGRNQQSRSDSSVTPATRKFSPLPMEISNPSPSILPSMEIIEISESSSIEIIQSFSPPPPPKKAPIESNSNSSPGARNTSSETSMISSTTSEKVKTRGMKRSASITSLNNLRKRGESSTSTCSFASLLPPRQSKSSFVKALGAINLRNIEFTWTIFLLPLLAKIEYRKKSEIFPGFVNSIHDVCFYAGYKSIYLYDEETKLDNLIKPGRIYLRNEMEFIEARRLINEYFSDSEVDRAKVIYIEMGELSIETMNKMKEEELEKYILSI